MKDHPYYRTEAITALSILENTLPQIIVTIEGMDTFEGRECRRKIGVLENLIAAMICRGGVEQERRSLRMTTL